jgi:glycine cleavage system H lipoate-binding protein
MEKDGLVNVGVDDFLLQITGQLTGIKMKVSGEKIRKGQVIVTLIQEGKQINIKSPVSGTIKRQNPELLTDANIINDQPYADGWIYMVEPSNWLREIQFMFMADVFRPWLKIEISRLKDFLASLKKQPEAGKYSLVLQEGGELKYGILTDMEPEVWEEFQNKFMETA